VEAEEEEEEEEGGGLLAGAGWASSAAAPPSSSVPGVAVCMIFCRTSRIFSCRHTLVGKMSE
jgi:hypothetical protein